MPRLPGRVPDEARALARRRLASLTRSVLPREHAVPDHPDVETVHRDPEERTPGHDLGERLRARLPRTVRGGRVVVNRAAASGLVVVALGACVLGGSYAWRSRAVEAVLPVQPVASSSASVGPPSVSVSASAGAGGSVVVDVAGKVRRPGVVTLPIGSRVVDAIEAAGGVRSGVDLSSLNLARVLVDGEQVLVGAPGSAPSGAAPTNPPGSDPSGGVIDLNTATLEQLDTLPGVGPVLAQRILDWRTAHGRFSTIEELREVSGIGDSRFADLAPHVRV